MQAATATLETRAHRSALERWFRIGERGSSVRLELLGGLSTFLTMSYILFVNPAILSTKGTGLEFGPVAVATALAACIATLAMGLLTNYPFALASGLGLNAVVAFDIILGHDLPWQVGMACIVIEGLLALVLVVAGLREAIMHAIPTSLKLAIGVGIGLFIALVGLRDGGVVVNDPATGIGLGDLTKGPPLVALGGVLVAAILSVRNVRGAILIGVLSSTALGLIFGVLDGPSKVAEIPGSGSLGTIGDAWDPDNLGDALQWALVPTIFALFMTDFFDTLGTVVAVGRTGGLLDKAGQLPGIRRVLMVDSGAAALGGTFGVSSVTTYVESGAGVGEGARTGLASVVTAALFGLAVFFVPLIAVVGQGVAFGSPDNVIHPAVAPALILVGYLMMRIVPEIDWATPEHALPAFLTIAGIPLTFSISAGIGFGVIGYVATMVARGRAREVHPLMYALVPLFAAFYASDWLSAHVF
ncbi:MAG: NCS2 family permease [Thermoleophilaceae bacterium]|nr:NCS2 family permease [Thermoleophilaceae bacterium]